MSVHGSGGVDARFEAIADAFAEAAREATEAMRGLSSPALGSAQPNAAAAWAGHVAAGLIEGAMKNFVESFADAMRDALAAGASPRVAAATARRSGATAAPTPPMPGPSAPSTPAASMTATPAPSTPARRTVTTPTRTARPAPARAARRTTARVAKKATPRPKNAHAITAGRKMNVLAVKIREAVNDDGRVDAQEKRELEKLAKEGLAHAEKLVRTEGDPAIAAETRVLNFLKTGQLALHKDEAIRGLFAGRKAMLAEVDKHAKTNAFAHLGRTWSAPYHGVRTKDFTFEGKRVHVVAIDLADPRVSLDTNGPAGKGTTVKRQAQRKDAEIAINGDFFSWGSYRPSEPAMYKGKEWGGQTGPYMAFDGARADIKRNGKIPDWADNAVGGRPMVLKDGAVVDTSGHQNGGVERRTGMGLSKDGRVMYMVAGASLSGNALARLMKSVGADEAIAMDGGGSAQMYQKGRGLVQASSDPGGERRVANTILIQAQRRPR